MTLVKSHARIGAHTRFGPNWTGKRCLAKTLRSTACQRVRTSTMGAARYMVAGQLDLGLSGA